MRAAQRNCKFLRFAFLALRLPLGIRQVHCLAVLPPRHNRLWGSFRGAALEHAAFTLGDSSVLRIESELVSKHLKRGKKEKLMRKSLRRVLSAVNGQVGYAKQLSSVAITSTRPEVLLNFRTMVSRAQRKQFSRDKSQALGALVHQKVCEPLTQRPLPLPLELSSQFAS
jgi:hypothetical protein